MIVALNRLRGIKLLHTFIWFFFAAWIVLIPILAVGRRFDGALLAIGIVTVEVGVLVVNGLRCPLTAIAARYTDDRRDNFDIYLPEWLARHNKQIFGTLFLLGVVLTLVEWLR